MYSFEQVETTFSSPARTTIDSPVLLQAGTFASVTDSTVIEAALLSFLTKISYSTVFGGSPVSFVVEKLPTPSKRCFLTTENFFDSSSASTSFDSFSLPAAFTSAAFVNEPSVVYSSRAGRDDLFFARENHDRQPRLVASRARSRP